MLGVCECQLSTQITSGAEYIAKKVVKFSRNVRDAVKLARLSKTKKDVDKWVGVMVKYSGG